MGYGIEIDIYGKCGNLTYGINSYYHKNYKTDGKDEPCREMTRSTYKSYFALESAYIASITSRKSTLTINYDISNFWMKKSNPY